MNKHTLAPVIGGMSLALALSAANAQALDPGKLDLSWYGVADVTAVAASSGFGRKVRFEGGGGMQASRLGLRANRVFGDGVTALATLEAGVQFDTGSTGSAAPVLGINDTNASSGGAPGNGARIFARQIFAGVRGSFGQATIGRQYTGSYFGGAVIGSAWGDGFYANPVNITPLVGGMPTRVDNSLVYLSPNLAGFSGMLTLAAGSENNVDNPTVSGTAATTVSDKSGQGWDLLVRYSGGPFSAGLSSWAVNNASWNATAGETGLAKKKGVQLVASYDFDRVLLAGAYVNGKISGGNYENVTRTLSKADAWSLSARIPFGADKRQVVFLAYTSLNDKSPLNRDAKLWGGAYWYQLETNLRLYVHYGQVDNNANAQYALADAGNLTGNVTTPGVKPKGVGIGINYAF